MRAAQRLLNTLLPTTRLIWIVVMCIALQPLAWAAQQTEVLAVSMPYCTSATADSSGTSADSPAHPAPAHPSYVLLLQTATVCSHDHAQTWMPPHHAAPFCAPPSLHYGFVSIRAWAPAGSGRHLHPLSRAPPQHA
jgi:hypothetical protein